VQGPIDDPIPVSPTGPLGGSRRRWWQRWTQRVLEDEPVPDGADPEATSSDRHDVVTYDLADWTPEQRMEVDEQLGLSEVPHEWVGGHLHVPGAHEALVDELVDVIDDADELAFPGRTEVEVEYEFGEWTPQQRDDLVAQLQAAEVPFGWDGVNLGVRAADEATVDDVVAAIDPDFPLREP